MDLPVEQEQISTQMDGGPTCSSLKQNDEKMFTREISDMPSVAGMSIRHLSVGSIELVLWTSWSIYRHLFSVAGIVGRASPLVSTIYRTDPGEFVKDLLGGWSVACPSFPPLDYACIPGGKCLPGMMPDWRALRCRLLSAVNLRMGSLYGEQSPWNLS